MTAYRAPIRRYNHAGVDVLLDWLRIHLSVLLCGGIAVGISIEEARFAVTTAVAAKHQKSVQEQPPNGYVAALTSRSVETQNIQTALSETTIAPAETTSARATRRLREASTE